MQHTKSDWQQKFERETGKNPAEFATPVLPYYAAGEQESHDLKSLIAGLGEKLRKQAFVVNNTATSEHVLTALSYGANLLWMESDEILHQQQLSGVDTQLIELIVTEAPTAKVSLRPSTLYTAYPEKPQSILCGNLHNHLPAKSLLQNATKSLTYTDKTPIYIRASLGTDYFYEIARLRAFRLLWAEIAKELGLNPTCYLFSFNRLEALDTQLEQSLITLSSIALAGVNGAADGVGFLFPEEMQAVQSIRLSQNIHNLICYESGLPIVIDPGFKADYIEAYTAHLLQTMRNS